MKIAIFVSGHVRTLFYKFHENLDLIREKVGSCDIDVYYSFWDDYSRSDLMNDDWHIKVEYDQPDISVESINQYFLDHGVNHVEGEIESTDVMNEVLNETPFLPERNGKNCLSSQYYKKFRVVEKYYSDKYDFYLTMRADVVINDFPLTDQIESIVGNKSLVVNYNYWYNEPYANRDVNEMIWCSNNKVFEKSNQIYLNQDKLSKQLSYHYGELVTGTYFNNLLKDRDIEEICVFDFKYRIMR